MLGSCCTLTKAPPSLSLGMISVTLSDMSAGMADLTRRMGSMMPRDELSNRRRRPARSRSGSAGILSKALSLIGKRSVRALC